MTKKQISIVISGWPAVGKTTMADSLAKEFGLTLYNGGDILKMLAQEKGYSLATSRSDWWDTPEAKTFIDERKKDPSFDRQVDKKLENILKSESAVITSYTLPWLVNDDKIIKFWLKGSQKNRALRMANRDRISYEEAEKIVMMRDEENKKIYFNLYGFTFGQDLSVFDYALSTDHLRLDSLIDISKMIVRNHVGRE